MNTNRMSNAAKLSQLSEQLTSSIRHSRSTPESVSRSVLLSDVQKTENGIRRILVPLDGTVFAEYAVPVALAMAEQCDAIVQLAHVLVPNEVLAPFEMLHFPEVALNDKKNRKHEYLSRIVDQIKATASVGVSSAVIQGTDISNTLDETYSDTADLVVMSTHGRGPLGRFWWGSVAHSLLQRTTVPLVLVQGKAEKSNFTPQTIDNVILPIEGDKQSEKIVEPLSSLGLFADAHHTLLHVTRPELTIADASGKLRGKLVPSSSREALGMEYLRPLVNALRDDNRQLQTKVISSEKPVWQVVADYVNHCERPLIACTYRRTRLLERVVWPGMSEHLLRMVKCPLLLVPS